MSTRAEPLTGDHGVKRRMRPNHERVLSLLEQYSLVVIFLGVVVAFSFWGKTSDTFRTSGNFDNIVGNQAVFAIAALALLLPLVCGQFDISVGSIVGMGSLVSAKLLAETSLPLSVCVLAALLTGATIGFINGFLVARIGINALVATLGMATLLSGIASLLTDDTPIISGLPAGLSDFGSGKTIGVPNTLLVLIAAALLVWYILEQTPFGRSLHLVGSSPEAAKLVGLRSERLMILAFTATGAIAGLTGVLYLARSGSGDPSVGFNFTLPAFAGAYLGATTIKPGRFNVLGTLVAIFLLGTAVSGLSLAGAPGSTQDLFNGGALIIGVGVASLFARQRLRGRQSRTPAPTAEVPAGPASPAAKDFSPTTRAQ
jgi:ribose transport system permease protein